MKSDDLKKEKELKFSITEASKDQKVFQLLEPTLKKNELDFKIQNSDFNEIVIRCELPDASVSSVSTASIETQSILFSLLFQNGLDFELYESTLERPDGNSLIEKNDNGKYELRMYLFKKDK